MLQTEQNGTSSFANDGQQDRLKVLLSVYACEPHRGSEPGVGWNMVVEMSKHHDVWVMTATEHQEAIEREIAENPIPNVHWIFQHVPKWLSFWKKGERGRRVHYYMWQVGAYFTGKRLQQQVNFDIIHHVTYVTYWTPSFLALLPPAFIWGPVGGAEGAPQSFYDTLKPGARRYERIRELVRGFFHTFDPFVGRTARRANICLSTTEQTKVALQALGATNIHIMPESALPDEDIDMLNALPPVPENANFRMMSLGRLLGWKGFHLGLMAFAELQKSVPDSEYWIIGEGSEEMTLKQLAKDLGVEDKVHFTGRIPRAEALKRLGESHLLVHPSMHDSGGWVCIEAMAAGRPVVCLNLGGPATQITDETGFRVEATTPEQAVNDMAAALKTLAEDPELIKRMGAAGKKRVDDDFRWDKKTEKTSKIYYEVLAEARAAAR